MKSSPYFLSILRARHLVPLLLCLSASPSFAWILTSTGGTATIQDPPAGSVGAWVHIPNLDTKPRIYFCIELKSGSSTTLTSDAAECLSARADPFNTTATVPWLSNARTDRVAWWARVLNSSDYLSTFDYYSDLAFVFTNPSSPAGGRQYKIGNRVYGYFNHIDITDDSIFLTVRVKTGGNGTMKIMLSDQSLYERLEPDVVALPVTNSWGEPSITVGGVADKTTISSPVPASYTLAWNAAGASSFKVTGGTGNGAIAAAGITSGTSRAFTNVAQSTQSYVLATQGPATIAWKLSAASSWEIFSGATSFGSGSGTSATANVTIKGVYILRVNGVEKTAADETINVTDGFLKRSKTVNLTIGSP